MVRMNDMVENRLEERGVETRGGGWYKLPDGEKVRGARNALRQASTNGASNEISTERLRAFRKTGFQYGGDRDIYTVAGYPEEQELDADSYWQRYDRQHIAGRLVDIAPQATWRHAPEIHEGEREGTEFLGALEELIDRDDLRFTHRMERIDRQSRIGRFGGLMIGQATATDRQLEDELEQMSGPSDVIYLSSFDERHIEVVEWEDDPTERRFGHPTTYRVDLSSGVSGFSAASDALVHWSRIIHVAEDPLSDDIFGRPALKRVFNLLYDLEKITAATAEAYWQLADRILVASIHPDAQFDDKEGLGEALEEMIHDLRRQFGAQGIDLDWLGGETPDPSSAVDLYMTLIASAAQPGIPKRMLFGSETGERASTEDKKTWHETISSRQEHHAEPVILRATLNRLIEYGGLPKPADGYMVDWPNLFETPEADEAEVDNQRADAAKKLTPVGGDPSDVARVTEDGRVELIPSEEEME